AIAELPGATACSDAGSLLARPEPSGAAELREHVRRAAALRRSGRLHDADEVAPALRELGGLADGARASALHELAALARAHGDHEDARRLARDAYLAARHAEHDELSARAALQLADVELASVRGDTSAATTWIGFARVELERGVADPRLWIPLLRAHARVLEATGDHAGARAQRERARELAASDESRALFLAELAVELAAGALASGDAAQAALAYPDAIAALERERGADHPALAVARTGFADGLARIDDHARALAEHRRAAAIERAAIGVAPRADATLALADELVRAGDPEAARALLSEAIDRLSPTGDTLPLARASATLGELDLDRGDPGAALPRLTRALAIRRALLGDDDIAVARTQVTIGDALLELDRRAPAKDAFRAAIEGWQRAGAEADATLAHAKDGLVRAEARGDAAGAAAIVPAR
ncbi:MAG TPA: tetratricopeptide repeat protein, partial [Nannocystaceae bacterium]|nr:tetratricopeptide repeat protein [Nannocystaceae bacterium]